MHARTQKGGVPEEAEIGRTITRFVFFTCALGAPMTDSPLDAVSAAEPLCTHGKDHPGLGHPNSLKLVFLIYYNSKSNTMIPVITTNNTRYHVIEVEGVVFFSLFFSYYHHYHYY